MHKNQIIIRKNNEETAIDRILKPISKKISLIGLGVRSDRAKEMSILKRGSLELSEGISEKYDEVTNEITYKPDIFAFLHGGVHPVINKQLNK